MTTTISYTYETYSPVGELLANGYVQVETKFFYPPLIGLTSY